ncbi:MAG: hypothetical protein EBS19_16005, partial [Spirochaetia bacterium]|nr:hypothetical protein [Spirochaetia bacterium]
MMYMRLMEFGANWGSTPGAPLVAGMQALKQTLPNVITDKKEQKSTMRTIDKAIYEVNHADYLEKKGQVKEASILKQRASERIMDEHKTLVDAGLKQLELESKERQNREDNTTRI